MTWLVVGHAGVTLALVGVIWFVQVVHYPLLGWVPITGFTRYEREHLRRASWMVVPLMIIEAVTAVALVAWPPAGVWPLQALLGLALLAVVWVSTFFVQVRHHRSLERGFDPAVYRNLVRGNWIRTTAWSARGLVVLWMANAAA